MAPYPQSAVQDCEDNPVNDENGIQNVADVHFGEGFYTHRDRELTRCTLNLQLWADVKGDTHPSVSAATERPSPVQVRQDVRTSTASATRSIFARRPEAGSRQSARSGAAACSRRWAAGTGNQGLSVRTLSELWNHTPPHVTPVPLPRTMACDKHTLLFSGIVERDHVLTFTRGCISVFIHYHRIKPKSDWWTVFWSAWDTLQWATRGRMKE